MEESAPKTDVHGLVYCQKDSSIINCDIIHYLKNVSTEATHKIDMLNFPEKYWLDIYGVYGKEGLSEIDHSEMREKFMAVIMHYSEPSISYLSLSQKGSAQQCDGRGLNEEGGARESLREVRGTMEGYLQGYGVTILSSDEVLVLAPYRNVLSNS